MAAALLGLGNILLRDEGIGVHVVNTVKERYAFSPEVEIIDGGTMGLDLLPVFELYDKILIIDAVDFGREPGHIGVVEGGDIPSVLNPKLSVHHIGLSDILFTARLVREEPLTVSLIGIQPGSTDVGLEMTGSVSEKQGMLVDMAIRKLGEWNITHVSRDPVEDC